MSESAFLQSVASFLENQAGLNPAPATIGIAEPEPAATAMPAVVLSLEDLRRPGNGLGERSALITDGVLPWSATIDLANPVLPEEPGFSLISPDRRTLILPHGGLVRADGGSGPLGPADLTVAVDGVPRTVVSGAPTGDQVQAEPLVGRLLFGMPLPPTGTLVATYRLGQWEQRLARIAGTLRVDVRAIGVPPLQSISDAVAAALPGPLAPIHIRRLHRMMLSAVSSIGPADSTFANSRLRTLRFAFDVEQEINLPESSGGIIQRVPITTRLLSASVDPATGTITTTMVEESE